MKVAECLLVNQDYLFKDEWCEYREWERGESECVFVCVCVCGGGGGVGGGGSLDTKVGCW